MTEIEQLKISIDKLTVLVERLLFNDSPFFFEENKQPLLPDKSRKDKPTQTLNEWLYVWLNDYKKSVLKPNTFVDYCGIVRNHISDEIGHLALNELSTLDIQKFINSIDAGRTRKGVFTLLRSALEKARKINLLEKNPCDNVEVEDYDPVVRRPFTKTEQRRFVRAVQGTQWETLMMLYLTTGIRKSEALNITPDYAKKIMYVEGTKTKTSRRYVPLPETMIILLKDFFREGNSFEKNINGVGRAFRRFCKTAKIKGVCVHSLRHTYATRCYESGVQIEIISEWLGHSNVETTRRYIHKLMEYQQKNAKLIDKVFD